MLENCIGVSGTYYQHRISKEIRTTIDQDTHPNTIPNVYGVISGVGGLNERINSACVPAPEINDPTSPQFGKYWALMRDQYPDWFVSSDRYSGFGERRGYTGACRTVEGWKGADSTSLVAINPNFAGSSKEIVDIYHQYGGTAGETVLESYYWSYDICQQYSNIRAAMKANAESLVTESVGRTVCKPQCKDGFFLVDGIVSSVYDSDTRENSWVMNTFGCNYENYNEETYKWFVEPQCRVERTCAPEYDCFEGGCSLDRFNVINGERKYWCYLKGTNPYQSTTCEDIEKSQVLCRDCKTTENPNGSKHDWFISYEICSTQIAALKAEQLAEATCQMEADCVSPGCVYNGVTDKYECRLKNVATAGEGLELGDVALTSCTDVVESGTEDVNGVATKIGKSVEICDAFAATQEAEKRCSPEVNCKTPCQPDNPTDATAYDHPKRTCAANDDDCILQRSWCELKNDGKDDSCADSKDSATGAVISTQLYKNCLQNHFI